MNDDTDKPLNPVGDAALEARITAWVLGEASPFEAAELEEICARDPEARLFERRLRVLHGFITADRKAGPEEEWKLPAEKRAKIEALFEEPVVLGEEDREPEKVGIRYLRKPMPPRQTGRRALLALAACTVISAAGWMLFSSVGQSAKSPLAMQEKAAVSALRADQEGRRRTLEGLRGAIAAQEDAVEDKRKLLSQITRTEGIGNADRPRGFTSADNAESATKAVADLEQEKIQIEGQIENLLRYDGTQLMNYASGLVAPDDALAAKVPQLQEAKRDYNALKSQGLADNHPDVKAKAEAVVGMESDVVESVNKVRETLKAKLALSNEQLAQLKSRMDLKEEDAIRSTIARQDFATAKNDFESSQRDLESLKQQLASEEMRMKLSDDDALAMAPTFAAGGGGGGSGGFGGGQAAADAPADSYAFQTPTTPAAPAKPMGGPVSAPAAPPAPALDSLAAVEKKSERQSMDESLAELAEESVARRSKSSASGPPVKKPYTSYSHLGSNSPFTVKPALSAEDRAGVPLDAAPAEPAAETATATGAIALNEFGYHSAFGADSLGESNGQAASSRMDADVSDRFAWSLYGNTQRDSQFDLQARFRGAAPAPEGHARLGGMLYYADDAAAPFGGERPMDPSLAVGGRSGVASGGSAASMPADSSSAIAGIATAGNRAGLGRIDRNGIDAILNNPDRGGAVGADGGKVLPGQSPAEPPANLLSDASKGGLTKDLSTEMNGTVKDGSTFFDVDAAGKKEQAQQASNENAWGKDMWFGRATESNELTDAALAKKKGDSAGAAATPEFKVDGIADGPVDGRATADYSGLAQKEMIRRQNAVATSDKLRDEGRDAYAKGDYKAAVDKYKASLDVLPDADMVQDRRNYLSQVLADGSTALGEEYRRVGKYDEARKLAGDALALDANNAHAKTLQNYLDDPIGNNPALTYEHTQNTDEVRRKLYIAEGSYNLGKFDDANRTYEDVLRIDPHNKAARRGMESVAKARSDYYRAAYDQTRAQLLAEVDKSWELAVPPTNQEASKELADLEGVKSNLSSLAEAAANPAEFAPKLEKAIREGEERLKADPNSPEIQEHLRVLGKMREDIRSQSEVDAKGAKLGEQEKSPVPVLPAETLTSAEPFSTFSLHVSDASFKMAKAALDRGEVPAADSIRPEEFYNAFDFGDPSPANGEPVVCAVEQCAHPALPQRNLLRIGVETGSQGRGGSTPLNLTLLLDSSGSMEREDRNAGLANAVQQLSGLLKEGDTVSVIGFARQPRLLVDRLPGNRAQELNAIFAQTPSEGGTNLEEGIKLGEELALRQFNPAAQNRIVLFTDGAANLGDAKPETLQAKVEHMRQKGIAFDAAGFGTEGLNDKLLERLTRNGNGRYYIVDRAEDADANFAKQLAGAFRPAAENVKVQVRFNPARVAKYKLIGFEEHRLKKEDFRNDAVDAAEMAAEEAGNALYQIETLPQGEGEVGEVSVRFRDTASGQMVERTWTIPYEAQAPAFDQAAPAIQLAGLAAFAAEKLRAAPIADAVDFQQLAPVTAKVKARYASSKQVAELEAMIGKLK